MHSNLTKYLCNIYNNDSSSNVTNVKNKFLMKMNQHVTITRSPTFTSASIKCSIHDHNNNNNQIK